MPGCARGRLLCREINYLVPLLFGLTTSLFITVVVAAKLRGRRGAVAHARQVFLRDGQLTRPVVLRSAEYESVLRGWLHGPAAARLLALDVLASNVFLALMFRWSHEHIVYARTRRARARAVVLFFG